MSPPPLVQLERRHFDLASTGFWWFVQFARGEPRQALALFPADASEAEVRACLAWDPGALWDGPMQIQELERVTWH